jgi:hypothetical protein
MYGNDRIRDSQCMKYPESERRQDLIEPFVRCTKFYLGCCVGNWIYFVHLTQAITYFLDGKLTGEQLILSTLIDNDKITLKLCKLCTA